ncbi:MAG: class I SAM-dependent methyltransferase [Candidatus Thorarchaeota archaeon]
MSKFVNKYLDANKKTKILDIGSRRVNGKYTYKNLFTKSNWLYHGLDLEKGDNVDIIAQTPYRWTLPSSSYDVVISGQCLEHVQDIFSWIKEIHRIVKSKGVCCIIAPWQWPEHKAPVDCWRIMPDGMKYLLNKVAGFIITTVDISQNDVIGIGRKL